jgi:hypothetical protein
VVTGGVTTEPPGGGTVVPEGGTPGLGAGAGATTGPILGGTTSGTGTAGASGTTAGTGTAGAGGAKTSGGSATAGTTGAGGTSTGSTSNQAGASGLGDIGAWTDAAGVCPSGMTKVEIATVTDLADASRAEGSHATDPASVCYLIRNGRYVQSGSTLPLWVRKGGPDAAHRRIFVGESRAGVVIVGRGNLEASHVQLSNFTMDLTGYSQSGSFNTLDLPEGTTDLRIDHVTFTGDCKTGANGGHIENVGATDVVVESCLIEKFGRCGPNGHQDHGVYLANGSNLTFRNNEIRGNASRGIQLYTQGGEYGTLDKIVIERNRIHDNGHAAYEDGIAINGTDTGTISNVTIQRNLIYSNYYSGVREVGNAFKAIVIRNNTFSSNGVPSTSGSPSELNLDDDGSGAATSVTRNIFVAAKKVLNSCYSTTDFTVVDNLGQGTLPTGGACIREMTAADPLFVNAAAGDFHTQSPAAAGYGAFASPQL